jgi:hypothetical protein
VRLVDLTKQAAKPYHSHTDRVTAVACFSPATFISGGLDGAVHLHDTREPYQQDVAVARKRSLLSEHG